MTDHTSGTGNYVYVEDGFDNDSVNLLSPCINISALCSPTLGFWYHSFNGTDTSKISTLHIDIFYQGTWNLDIIPSIGSEIDAWQYKTADLSSFPDAITIRFRVNNNQGTPFHDIAIDDVEVMGGSGFTSNITGTNSTCSANMDGTATVSTNGGSAPFTYLWNDSLAQTTATATGLGVGTYTVIITDSSGCSNMESIVITSADSPILTISGQSATCNGACDGSATVIASGGTPPYTYLWNDPTAQTTATATGLCAGFPIVSVTDSNGCIVNETIAITEPSALTGTVTNVDTASQGVNNGSATVTVSGGTQPYAYLWDDPAAQTTATATGLAPGTYTCLVTDGNGCTYTVDAIVPSTVGMWDMNLGIHFEVHPNPTDGVIVIDIELLEISDLSIEVMDILGEVVYKRESDNILRYNKEANLSNLANGVYFVKITTEKGAIKKRIVISK